MSKVNFYISGFPNDKELEIQKAIEKEINSELTEYNLFSKSDWSINVRLDLKNDKTISKSMDYNPGVEKLPVEAFIKINTAISNAIKNQIKSF